MNIEEEQIQEIIDDLQDTKDTLIENDGAEWIIEDISKVLSKLEDLFQIKNKGDIKEIPPIPSNYSVSLLKALVKEYMTYEYRFI